MCGITGYISANSFERSVIDVMTDKLAHRGPDAKGTYANASCTVALGHTRLSIIDLSTGANQPFHADDGRHTIIFNGEIYNFRKIRSELIETYDVTFQTNSDTEVALKAFITWGSKMVDKLMGMFAIVILDKENDRLFLFRDRMGKKPLYYFQSEKLFAFASEMKALLAHPLVQREKKIDESIISIFLHLGYIPEPHTIYSNIYKFPAGYCAEIDGNLKLAMRPYWHIQSKIDLRGERNERQVQDYLKKLLEDAVQQRLISDVPLGTFLSGGTDSSIVTAIATKYSAQPIKTFSIGFYESKFDESQYSQAVAKHLKTDHIAYKLTEKEAVNLLETYVNHFDEPFADTSAIPTMLVSKLARQHVKVVLTGDGGDELFLGYGAYTWANRLRYFPNVVFGNMLQKALQNLANPLRRVSHLFEPVTIGGIRSHIFSQEQYFFSQKEVMKDLLKQTRTFKTFEYDESFLPPGLLTEGEKQALFDLQYYLKDDLLVKVDRASMFHALECRCPLLDYRIVTYLLSLKSSMKKKNGVSKWMLKELLKEYIPDKLIYRPKWGFGIPLSSWLKGDLQYLITDYLSKQAIEEIGVFNTEYVQELKKRFFGGEDYLYNRLWTIIILQKWLKENHY